MLQNINPADILFLDIETVPVAPSFSLLDPKLQLLWEKKSKQFRQADQTAEEVFSRAGIYAEFGKIICISAGFIKEKNPFHFRLKSFYGDNEASILKEFSSLIIRLSKSREMILCAHNGKEFDYPFIARRMVINRIAVPEILDTAGKKPWEVKHLDTMELWRYGDFKSFTSLDLLTTVLGIESPKNDIDGSMVAGLYYDEGDKERIVQYCERDVVAVARVLLRFMNLPDIDEANIESVTFSDQSV